MQLYLKSMGTKEQMWDSLFAKLSALPLETSSSFPKKTCTFYLIGNLALTGKVNPTILSVYWGTEHPLWSWSISDWTEIKAQAPYEKWETYFIKKTDTVRHLL